jgi:hypothetical protein
MSHLSIEKVARLWALFCGPSVGLYSLAVGTGGCLLGVVTMRDKTFLPINHKDGAREPVETWTGRGEKHRRIEEWAGGRTMFDVRYIERPSRTSCKAQGPAFIEHSAMVRMRLDLYNT